MKTHGDLQSAVDVVSGQLQEHMSRESFLVAAWSVDDDGEMRCSRTTWKFPSDKFDAAVDMLRKELDKESGVPDELPLAEFLRRAREGFNVNKETADAESNLRLVPDDEGDDVAEPGEDEPVVLGEAGCQGGEDAGEEDGGAERSV